jgi:hypothetical protein
MLRSSAQLLHSSLQPGAFHSAMPLLRRLINSNAGRPAVYSVYSMQHCMRIPAVAGLLWFHSCSCIVVRKQTPCHSVRDV